MSAPTQELAAPRSVHSPTNAELLAHVWDVEPLRRLAELQAELRARPVTTAEKRALVQGVLHLQAQFERDHGAERAREVLAETLSVLTAPDPRGRRLEALAASGDAWKRWAASVAHRLIRDGWRPGASSARPTVATVEGAATSTGLSAARLAEIRALTADECLQAMMYPHATIAIIKAVIELCPRPVSRAEADDMLREIVAMEERLRARYPDEQREVELLIQYALTDLLTVNPKHRDDLISGSTVGLVADERREILADSDPTRWLRYLGTRSTTKGVIAAAAKDYIPSLRAAAAAERERDGESSAAAERSRA